MLETQIINIYSLFWEGQEQSDPTAGDREVHIVDVVHMMRRTL